MRKMEISKHLEPHMSYSFEDLNEVLMQNYKDNSSVGSGSFLSGISGGKESSPIPNPTSGFNNNLKEKATFNKES